VQRPTPKTFGVEAVEANTERRTAEAKKESIEALATGKRRPQTDPASVPWNVRQEVEIHQSFSFVYGRFQRAIVSKTAFVQAVCIRSTSSLE
jgi:hypothetical protein